MNRLNDEQRQMVLDNINLAHKQAYKLHLKFPQIELEDMQGLCYEGLCRAVLQYNPSRGKLSTYAYTVMYRIIYQIIFPENNGSKQEVKYSSLDAMSTETYVWSDFIPYAERIEDNAVYDLTLDNLVKAIDGMKISPKNKMALKRIILDPDINQSEVGRDVGVSRERIRQLMIKFRPQARQVLEVIA